LWQTGEINLVDPTHWFSAPLQEIESGKTSLLMFGKKMNYTLSQLLYTVLNHDLVKKFQRTMTHLSHLPSPKSEVA